MIGDKEYDEGDKIEEIKANLIDSEESENDERYQIENAQSLKSIDNQQIRENVDIFDTNIDLGTDTVMEDSNKIT